MTSRRLAGFMPRGADSLLIQAAVAPTDQARRAWREWIRQRSLDQAGWAEVRMLPRIAARARELDIAAAHIPRLDGIRRFVWSGTQKQMMGARPVLAAFADHGLPALLLKGAAIICSQTATMAQRFLRDIDILVPAQSTGAAISLLHGSGWHAPSYGSLEELLYIGFVKSHALEFNGPGGGQVDLHRYAMAPGQFPGADDGLWSRAGDGEFLGVRCKLPSREDQLVNTLEHSYRRDPDRVLDWSLDAARLIETGGINWRLVADCALQRCLAVPLEGRLRYLREECGMSAIPATAVDSLEPMCGEKVFVDECIANQLGGLTFPGGEQRIRLRAASRRAARCASAKAGGLHVSSPGSDLALVRHAGGRRVDIELGDPAVDKVRIDVTHEQAFPRSWRIQVNCGSIQIRRLLSGEGPLRRMRRRIESRFSLNPILFRAQKTDRLSLILDLKNSGTESGVKENAGASLDCEARLRRDGCLLIRLNLRRAGRDPRPISRPER